MYNKPKDNFKGWHVSQTQQWANSKRKQIVCISKNFMVNTNSKCALFYFETCVTSKFVFSIYMPHNCNTKWLCLLTSNVTISKQQFIQYVALIYTDSCCVSIPHTNFDILMSSYMTLWLAALTLWCGETDFR